jgi:hypothetical protein
MKSSTKSGWLFYIKRENKNGVGGAENILYGQRRTYNEGQSIVLDHQSY